MHIFITSQCELNIATCTHTTSHNYKYNTEPGKAFSRCNEFIWISWNFILQSPAGWDCYDLAKAKQVSLRGHLCSSKSRSRSRARSRSRSRSRSRYRSFLNIYDARLLEVTWYHQIIRVKFWYLRNSWKMIHLHTCIIIPSTSSTSPADCKHGTLSSSGDL